MRYFTVTLLIAFSWAGFAQTSNQGAIYGVVTDPSGAVVHSANVEVVNTATGLERQSRSNGRGEYRCDFLPPGMYRISVTSSGFAQADLSDITLLVGQEKSVNVRLSVGKVTESVSVSTGSESLDVSDGSRDEVIDSKSISQMPLNGREFLSLATLVPGAESGSRPLDDPVPAKITPNENFVMGYNGSRGTYNSFYVDGGDDTSPEYNNMISSPSVDAIQEFSVETSSYSARYGNAAGGIINVVTKSGSNSFHGALYEYLRNKVFDALPYFYTGTRHDFPMSLWNQFGGSLGGPIRRKHTFFFFNAELFHQLSGGNQMVAFAPTDLERQGNVTQSVNPWAPGSPVTLYDPYTGDVIPSGILPPSLTTSFGQYLMSLLPSPNYPQNPYFNLRGYLPHHNDVDKYLGRIDQNFSPRNTLSGTFNFGNYSIGEPNWTKYGNKTLAENDRTLTVNYTHVFTPTIVNTMGTTATQYFNGDQFELQDKNYGQAWGLSPTVNRDLGSPAIQLFTTGFTPLFIGGVPNNDNFTRQLSFHDDFSWQKGSHTLQFGGMFLFQKYDWKYFSGGAGYEMNIEDGLPGLWFLFGVTGDAFTDLLSGINNVYQIGNGNGLYTKFWRTTQAAYFQDDWKATKRLTLNLGGRWEYERPFHIDDGKHMTLDFATGLVKYESNAPELNIPSYPFETGASPLVYTPQPRVLMPRFGFAYLPMANGKTVIRGGYGLYYTSEPSFVVQESSFVNPFGGVNSWWAKGLVGGWPDGKDHFVPMSQEPYGLDYQRGANPGNGVTLEANYYPRGYTEQWNLTLGQEFRRNVGVEVAYVGNQGINLNGMQSLQSYDPSAYARTLANYPTWGANMQTKGYNSNYHSLQVSAKRLGQHGLTFLGAYTYSHALADASNDTWIENVSPVVNQLGQQAGFRKFRSNAGSDVRHRASLDMDYELPFGPGRRWGGGSHGFLGNSVGGWDLSAIAQAQTGFPFSVYNTSDQLPDQVCNGNLPRSKRTATMWFDYNCFPTATLSNGVPIAGNARSNIIEGPGFDDIDLGIHKQFPFFEKSTLQFRLEAFNALNHTQLSSAFNGLNWFYNDASGAEITETMPSREIQLALRIDF